MWVPTTELPTSASHPFYARLNQLLHDGGFDDFAEARCASFYTATMGRPGVAPGIYFRLDEIAKMATAATKMGWDRSVRRGSGVYPCKFAVNKLILIKNKEIQRSSRPKNTNGKKSARPPLPLVTPTL